MNQRNLKELISVARGQSPADLLLANARIINVFSGEIEQGNVAVYGGSIAGIGDYHQGRDILDLKGKYLAPGFIDGHTHVESSLLYITQYARAVVPHGTTAVVTDLHEVANVCGLEGARQILMACDDLPLDVFFMVPSCVPATHLETAGAEITADSVQAALNWKHALGLGEMMNFPGVINCDPEVLLKLAFACGLVIDGHAPGLSGRDLNAYAAAGIRSDHESTSLEEAREKLNRGMWVMIREGSSEKNLTALLPLVTDKTWHRCFFVVDDRSCVDLLADGDIDAVVRKAIQLGLDPIRAIQMATINPAQYFSLEGLGAIAPGYQADLVVFSDLASLGIEMVFHRGRLVTQDGHALFNEDSTPGNALRHTVKMKPFGSEALRIPADKRHQPVIEIVPGQIITKKNKDEVKVRDSFVVSDVERDMLKLAVVERHKASGNIGLGLVKGFGLKKGALASSVAHDSHNVIAVGADDGDMFEAIREIERLQGGLVVAGEGHILASLPLPIAGLLSDEPLEAVVAKLAYLESVAADLGCTLNSPFSTLSFLALPVIPEIRLTDLGLVDVESYGLLT
ncbi:MAG: adenine deaminase [Chloroflexi bacterium RBG_13_53_26]|nr:MAG: adenine deaminase [Chloroflexi bacterium RBG_13_53_26]